MSDKLPCAVQFKPFYRELTKRRSYVWCACGLSKKQPFCDGSHQGTEIEPVVYRAREDGEEVLFCGCKQSRTKPFCDGAHNNLPGYAGEDDPLSETNLAIPEIPVGNDGLAMLDGGCYVTKLDRQDYISKGTLRFCPIISKARGALYQSQFHMQAAAGASPILCFGERHVILFVSGGDITVEIGDQHFETRTDSGVYIRPGEVFRVINEKDGNENDRPVDLFAAVCPHAATPIFLDHMSEASFDCAWPERRVAVDLAAKQAMGDRFFQMLVDKSIGSDVVTQFIGEIPLSKAPPHRHLYEESLIILRGRGCMWTETAKAPVDAGDVIFLPRKLLHSLQCTDPGGMLVVGVIYPGDNPTINY
ncbi:MAG: CDGSH iron-sulfur domain-containing protein [Geminicoccaceae bacterium]